jgi:hypothetical protein
MLSTNSSKHNTLSALLSLAAGAGHREFQYKLGETFKIADRVKAAEWHQKGMLSRILQNVNTLSAFHSPVAEIGNLNAQ